MANSIAIFGANSDLGKALYQIKLKQGCIITLFSKSPPQYTLDPSAEWITADLADACVDQLLQDKTFDQYCSFYRDRNANDLDNFTNTYSFHNRLLDYLDRQGTEFASIVLCSSPAAQQIAANQNIGYHLGKSSIEQLVRFYAVKLGAKGIRVNGVRPCLYYKNKSQINNVQLQKLEHLAAFIPLQRIAEADEVANVADFLLSNLASYLTGQTIDVDGGMSLKSAESIITEAALKQEVHGHD